MEDKQLSFEENLYERERRVLFLLSGIGQAKRNLHYQRTQFKTYVSQCGNVKKCVRYSKEILDGMSRSMIWMADLEYELSKEIPSKKQHPWDYFGGLIEADHIVAETSSTPYTVYQGYINIYQTLSKVIDEYPTIINDAPLCRRRVEELWKDMQDLGESLERLL